MALVLADRVKETTTTTGTGTYTLAGAVTGFESFGSIGNGNTTYYCCTDDTDFEVGIGTYTSSGTTLARTTILQSSNSDNAVSWSSGTRTIFCTIPAEKLVFEDASGDVVVPGALTATTKSFLIDHPTKAGMKLRYASLEGPENGVYVRGQTRENIITLPDYWAGLVDEDSITVNVTPIGRDQGIYVESWDVSRVILSGTAINCFYTVYAERKDIEPFEVEYMA